MNIRNILIAATLAATTAGGFAYAQTAPTEDAPAAAVVTADTANAVDSEDKADCGDRDGKRGGKHSGKHGGKHDGERGGKHGGKHGGERGGDRDGERPVQSDEATDDTTAE